MGYERIFFNLRLLMVHKLSTNHFNLRLIGYLSIVRLLCRQSLMGVKVVKDCFICCSISNVEVLQIWKIRI